MYIKVEAVTHVTVIICGKNLIISILKIMNRGWILSEPRFIEFASRSLVRGTTFVVPRVWVAPHGNLLIKILQHYFVM
jgi:hypothetical protein